MSEPPVGYYGDNESKDIDYSKLAFESDRVALDRYRRLSFKGEIEAVRGTRPTVPS